jgi:Rod binding domain-containing protein
MTTYTSPLATPGASALMQAKQQVNQSLLAQMSPSASKYEAKAKATAQDFEAVFLNQMFQQMFTGINGEGPFGGGPGVGVWRSFLTDEYAKSFAKAGGVGIGDQVYRELIARQSAQTMKAMSAIASKAYAPTAGATP